MDRRDRAATLAAAKTVLVDNCEYLKMEGAEVIEPISVASDVTTHGCEHLNATSRGSGAEYVSWAPVDREDAVTRSRWFNWARRPLGIQLISAPTTVTDDAACSTVGLNYCATRVSKPHSSDEANRVSKAHRIHLLESKKKTTSFETYPMSPSEEREEIVDDVSRSAKTVSSSHSSIEAETVSKTRRIRLELTSISHKDDVEYAMMDHDDGDSYGQDDEDDGDHDGDDDGYHDGYHDWIFSRLFLFHLGVILFPFVMGTRVRCVAYGVI
jgi:hypothetical protein